MDETPTAPNYYLDSDWGWNRKCVVCGRRLKDGSGPRCKRTSCVLKHAARNPSRTTTNFGGDGAQETTT